MIAPSRPVMAEMTSPWGSSEGWAVTRALSAPHHLARRGAAARRCFGLLASARRSPLPDALRGAGFTAPLCDQWLSMPESRVTSIGPAVGQQR